MQRFLTTLTIWLLFFFSSNLYAQAADTSRLAKVDTTQASISPAITDSYAADDDLPGLILDAIIIFSAAAGAFVIGASVAMVMALLAAALLGAGIISTSLLVGLYSKSIKAGFKTLVVILSALGGLIIGGVGLFLIAQIFKLHISNQTALLTGSLGGLGGGILTGFIIYRVIMFKLQYARKKLNLA